VRGAGRRAERQELAHAADRAAERALDRGVRCERVAAGADRRVAVGAGERAARERLAALDAPDLLRSAKTADALLVTTPTTTREQAHAASVGRLEARAATRP
jgi:hypothetical protein